MTSHHMKNINSTRAVHAKIPKVTMILQPGLGCIIDLKLDLESIYRLLVSENPDCSYLVLKKIIAKLGGRREPCRPCKHLYFVTRLVCKFDVDIDLFIHAPTFSFNEVKKILGGGILDHATELITLNLHIYILYMSFL